MTSEPTRLSASTSQARISLKPLLAKLVTMASMSSSTTSGGLPPKHFLLPLHERILSQRNPESGWLRLARAAGTTISLPAAVLRSSRLEILGAGSGNAPVTPEIWVEAIRRLMSHVACGALRIDTERVPLGE